MMISCNNSSNEYLHCWERIQKNFQIQKEYIIVQNQLKDTIDNWISVGITDIARYKSTHWKIDKNIYFNSGLDKAILIVLRQDTASIAKMDFVNLVFAKKQNNDWHFYYKSMPSLYASRYYDKLDPTIPYTFEELSLIAKKNIFEGGYFKNENCEINDKYINGWYNETLERRHAKFLKKRL